MKQLLCTRKGCKSQKGDNHAFGELRGAYEELIFLEPVNPSPLNGNLGNNIPFVVEN